MPVWQQNILIGEGHFPHPIFTQPPLLTLLKSEVGGLARERYTDWGFGAGGRSRGDRAGVVGGVLEGCGWGDS